MLIREYTEADLDALRRMHASQGFDYAFPDLTDPIFISKLVLEDNNGRIAMASLARLTCEMYLLVDRDHSEGTSPSAPGIGGIDGAARAGRSSGATRVADRSPATSAAGAAAVTGSSGAAKARYAQLLALHDSCERDLLARGLDDAHAWLPPSIARRFGRRLNALGWVRDDAWTPYCRRLRGT